MRPFMVRESKKPPSNGIYLKISLLDGSRYLGY